MGLYQCLSCVLCFGNPCRPEFVFESIAHYQVPYEDLSMKNPGQPLQLAPEHVQVYLSSSGKIYVLGFIETPLGARLNCT